MEPRLFAVIALSLILVPFAFAGQVPGPASAPDIPISHRDRVYAGEQFSNTVSVIDPSTNTLLGEIRLGEPPPANLSPLYRGQLLVHGLGFSPDHRTLVVVSIGSNSVSFIDTTTNAVKHVTYVGRSPHEAFFTPNGKEVWITVRGEDYVAVLDAKSYAEIKRIKVPNGPGMTIFSPDGRYGYVCSSFTPETVVISTKSAAVVGRIKQQTPFCPNIAATPDGDQVWFTLKDVGKVQVFDARPPFAPLRTIDAGPIANHTGPIPSNRLRSLQSATCRTGCGPRATAPGSMSGSRTPMALRSSTRSRIRWSRPLRSARRRRRWSTFRARCRPVMGGRIFSPLGRQARPLI
jgi:YVTN family beta-propeller protein